MTIQERPRGLDAGGGRMPTQDEFHIGPDMSWSYRASRFAVKHLALATLDIETRGRDNLERLVAATPPHRPFIYVCNHISGLDGPLVAAFLPGNRPVNALVAGETITNNKLKEMYSHHVGHMIPVDRSAPKGQSVDYPPIYQVMNVPEGRQAADLLIFGGGGTGEHEDVLDPALRSGVVHFWRNTGASVIPIAINGLSRQPWLGRHVMFSFGGPVNLRAEMSDDEAAITIGWAIEDLAEPYFATSGVRIGGRLGWNHPERARSKEPWWLQRVKQVSPQTVANPGELMDFAPGPKPDIDRPKVERIVRAVASRAVVIEPDDVQLVTRYLPQRRSAEVRKYKRDQERRLGRRVVIDSHSNGIGHRAPITGRPIIPPPGLPLRFGELVESNPAKADVYVLPQSVIQDEEGNVCIVDRAVNFEENHRRRILLGDGRVQRDTSKVRVRISHGEIRAYLPASFQQSINPREGNYIKAHRTYKERGRFRRNTQIAGRGVAVLDR